MSLVGDIIGVNVLSDLDVSMIIDALIASKWDTQLSIVVSWLLTEKKTGLEDTTKETGIPWIQDRRMENQKEHTTIQAKMSIVRLINCKVNLF